MENTKNEFAVGLGQKSWESISKGKTKAEIFAIMSAKKKGKKKTKNVDN